MTASTETKKLPVTLLSGFLGSGKTTLLQHILRSKDHGLRCAVIVNDMAEINIDGATIANNQLIQREEKLVEMHNGCICCTLREDLLEEINRLAADGRFDYLIIESTGVSEPMQVAETFTTDFSNSVNDNVEEEEQNEESQKTMKALQSLSETARLDTCVSMVDANSFFNYLNSAKFLGEEFKDAGDEDEKTVVDLLIDQVEFADVILLNKIDTVTKEQADKIEDILKGLNKAAKVIRCQYSKVDIKEILNTGLFDMDKAMTSSGWLRSLNEEVNPETIEYGISSFVYRQRRPFHPGRLFELIKEAFLIIENAGVPTESSEDEDPENEEDQKEESEEDMTDDDIDEMDSSEEKLTFDPKESDECYESKSRSVFKHVLRSKGFLWIAGYDKFMGDWSQAGIILTVSHGGNWYIDRPEEMKELDEDIKKVIEKDFHEDKAIGDRRQEIVFIGDFKDEQEKMQLKKALDSCLIEENEKINSDDNPWEEWL